jgi:hypothetical protein
MDYVLMALGVFWIVRLLQTWVDAPAWLWGIIQLALSVIVMLPWDNYKWFAPLGVAGIVAFLQMAENLLIAKSDEALSTIMRRR